MAEQWCKNKQAVKDTTRPRRSQRTDEMKAEADIILAIHHIKNQLSILTRIRHVYGHQDTKRSLHNDEHPQMKTHPVQVMTNIV
jgi:hypothetical protein